jgi:hypothetical protein
MSTRLAATTPATRPGWASGCAATLFIFFHQSLGFASQQRVNGVIAKRLNGSPTMTLDLDTLMRQMTEQKAKDALLTARSTLERSLRELDHYIERLDTAETLHDKSQVMNWALNALACNITPNLRLDLIANAQAELASVAK